MEEAYPEERPHKKRRFFAEDSSPAQPRTTRFTSPPPSPPLTTESNAPAQNAPAQTRPDEIKGVNNSDDFDVGMLQAVVGDLSLTTLQKLKDVSGNNVERGTGLHLSQIKRDLY